MQNRRSHSIELEQLDTLKNLWAQHKVFLIASLLIISLSALGFQQWRQWHTQRINQASMLYEKLLVEIKNADQAADHSIKKQMTQQLIHEYPQTPYATLARLIEAADNVKDNQLPQALMQLQKAKAHTQDALLKQMINLRIARVLIAMKKTKAAADTLVQIKLPPLTSMAQAIRKRSDLSEK